MCSALVLQKCVEAVAENAFKSSPYPVIITLENHTDEPNQKLMAKDLREVLGSKLYVPTEEDRKGTWKSPEYLKHKVGGQSDTLFMFCHVLYLKFKRWC
eukprot:1160722-Pelagomonas_calceolata.AAC.8